MQHRVPMGLLLAAPLIIAAVAILMLTRPWALAPDNARPAAGNTGAEAGNADAQAVRRPTGPPAPDFTGGGAWINSEPLALTGLRGKVVLVDFWTYGCYNCKNTLPYIKQWWGKYKDQGLVIVGVHTPEFSYEYVLENVREAVRSDGIEWPVVQDNDYTIWSAYRNHYWPHFYLIDHEGRIIYDHIGEGAYEETERQIAAALAAARQ